MHDNESVNEAAAEFSLIRISSPWKDVFWEPVRNAAAKFMEQMSTSEETVPDCGANEGGPFSESLFRLLEVLCARTRG